MEPENRPTCRCGEPVYPVWEGHDLVSSDRCKACIWRDVIWHRVPLPKGMTGHCWESPKRKWYHLMDCGVCLRCGWTPKTPQWLPKCTLGPDGYPKLARRPSDKEWVRAQGSAWLPAGGLYANFAKSLPAANKRLEAL